MLSAPTGKCLESKKMGGGCLKCFKYINKMVDVRPWWRKLHRKFLWEGFIANVYLTGFIAAVNRTWRSLTLQCSQRSLLSTTSHSCAKRSYWFYAQLERMTQTNSNKGILWQSKKIGESTETWIMVKVLLRGNTKSFTITHGCCYLHKLLPPPSSYFWP